MHFLGTIEDRKGTYWSFNYGRELHMVLMPLLTYFLAFRNKRSVVDKHRELAQISEPLKGTVLRAGTS